MPKSLNFSIRLLKTEYRRTCNWTQSVTVLIKKKTFCFCFCYFYKLWKSSKWAATKYAYYVIMYTTTSRFYVCLCGWFPYLFRGFSLQAWRNKICFCSKDNFSIFIHFCKEKMVNVLKLITVVFSIHFSFLFHLPWRNEMYNAMRLQAESINFMN